jgi:hypothetical protein
MKLQVVFEMPMPEGFEPYLTIIAKTHGWSEESGVTEIEYVCKEICEPQVSSLFSVIISNAVSGYLGTSGAEQVQQIIATYNELHTVTATAIEA